MDDLLTAWVEVDAVCRLAEELISEQQIRTAYTVLPWVRATKSNLADLPALAGDG